MPEMLTCFFQFSKGRHVLYVIRFTSISVRRCIARRRCAGVYLSVFPESANPPRFERVLSALRRRPEKCVSSAARFPARDGRPSQIRNPVHPRGSRSLSRPSLVGRHRRRLGARLLRRRLLKDAEHGQRRRRAVNSFAGTPVCRGRQ